VLKVSNSCRSIAVDFGGVVLHYRETHKKWQDDYDNDVFVINGREAVMVKPKIEPNGKWIVRPAFIGAFPSVDDSLLDRGWHVAYYDVTHEYGNLHAQKDFEKFVAYSKKKYRLNNKLVLEGFSRGGFFALCYAINHSEQIDKIYVDAPVCNLRSWPLKTEKTLYDDAKDKWQSCGLNIDSVYDFPIRHFDQIMKAKIPVVLVYGGRDTVAPYHENFGLIPLGGYRNIYKIKKPYCGHHPHSLPHCKKIVDFLDR